MDLNCVKHVHHSTMVAIYTFGGRCIISNSWVVKTIVCWLFQKKRRIIIIIFCRRKISWVGNLIFFFFYILSGHRFISLVWRAAKSKKKIIHVCYVWTNVYVYKFWCVIHRAKVWWTFSSDSLYLKHIYIYFSLDIIRPINMTHIQSQKKSVVVLVVVYEVYNIKTKDDI